MIRGMGSKNIQMNPITFTKAYDACVLSKVCYGTELASLSANSLESLENFHFDVAKKVQGIAKTSPNCVPLATLRWNRLHCEVDRRCLLFHGQILRLPIESLYKQVFVNRLVDIFRDQQKNRTGPTVHFIKTCKSVGLEMVVKECLTTGKILSKGEWKKEVDRCLARRESNEWQATVLATNRFTEFKGITTSYREGFGWWKVAKWNNKLLPKVKQMLRFLVMRIPECTGLKCECNVVDVSLTHILMECLMTNEVRTKEWEMAITKLPSAMARDLEHMANAQRINYMYTCFGCKPIREWTDAYVTILNFIIKMIDTWVDKCQVHT